MNLFAKRFKQERLKKELTQEELATRFHTNKSNISKYENANSLPGLLTLKEYADFFDVSIDYLLGRTDIPQYHKVPIKYRCLLQDENLPYLKIALKIKNNDISPEEINIFLDFYNTLKAINNAKY